jgi:hypothetical protein
MRADLLPNTYHGCQIRLIQETAEVIQAITKLLQYGPVAKDPKTGIEYDNVRDILSECNDALHAMATLWDYYHRRGVDIAQFRNSLALPIQRNKEKDYLLAVIKGAADVIDAVGTMYSFVEPAGDLPAQYICENALVSLQVMGNFELAINTLQRYSQSLGITITLPDIPITIIPLPTP